MKIAHILTILATAALAACGGTSNNPEGSPAQGLWVGPLGDDHTMTALIPSDGGFWAVYRDSDDQLQGFMHGPSEDAQAYTANDGEYYSHINIVDYDIGAGSTISDSTQALYFLQRTFSAPIKGQTFGAIFEANYNAAPALTAIAGTHTGTLSSLESEENATLVISVDGTIAGTIGGTCLAEGEVEADTLGNLYRASLTFLGGTCTLGTSTVTGVLFEDTSAEAYTLIATDESLAIGIIFISN